MPIHVKEGSHVCMPSPPPPLTILLGHEKSKSHNSSVLETNRYFAHRHCWSVEKICWNRTSRIIPIFYIPRAITLKSLYRFGWCDEHILVTKINLKLVKIYWKSFNLKEPLYLLNTDGKINWSTTQVFSNLSVGDLFEIALSIWLQRESLTFTLPQS